MVRITGLVAISLAFLFCVCISTGAERAKAAEGKEEKVSEVQGFQSVRLAWRAERTKPIVVTTPEELVTIMPNRIDVHTVRKQVNFEKQQLLIFAWEGDAQDRINVESDGSKVDFVHWGNLAGDDPHLHCKMFAIQKGVARSVTIEPDPR